MSTNERLLIITKRNGVSKSEFWDTSHPLGLGSPFKWVLENTKDTLRFRNLSITANEIFSTGVREIKKTEIDSEKLIALGDLDVLVKKTKPILPPYLPKSKGNQVRGTETALFSFAGVRKTLLSMSHMHSAYIAYVKNKPVLTIQQSPEGFTVKPLLAGVRYKPKGRPSVLLSVGENKFLTIDQFLNSTLTRGWYWWRFSYLTPPADLPGESTSPTSWEEEAEKKWLKRSLLLLLLFLFSIGIITRFLPEPEKPEEKPKEPEAIAKLVPKLYKLKKEVPQATYVEQPPSEAVKKPDKPSTRKPVPDSKVAINPVPVKAETPVAKPKSNQQSLAKVNQLKSILGELAHNISQKPSNKLAESTAPNRVSKSFFNANTPSLAPTDIKPILGGTNAKVERIGSGGGGKGLPGGFKDGVGYASGGIDAPYGKGGSFVAVDYGGTTVDEGLTKEEVGAVIHSHMREVRYCHEAALLRNPKLEGKLVLDFKIGPNGDVKSISVNSSSVGDGKLDQCIVVRLKTWQFPKPKGGVTVSVSYPFLFKTLRREE